MNKNYTKVSIEIMFEGTNESYKDGSVMAQHITSVATVYGAKTVSIQTNHNYEVQLDKTEKHHDIFTEELNLLKKGMYPSICEPSVSIQEESAVSPDEIATHNHAGEMFTAVHMTAHEMILSCLRNNKGSRRGMSPNDILEDMLANGYESNSRDPLKNTLNNLYTLQRKRLVTKKGAGWFIK